MTKPVRQVRISDQVADYIVSLIADEGFAPGDTLPSESELARRLGVSRPAVREATNALAGRGLISTQSGRSPRVLPVSQRPFAELITHALATRQVGMIEVLEVRRGLEETTAELAATNRSESEAEELQELASRMREVAGDAASFLEVDVLFHRKLSLAAGNSLMSAILAGIADVARKSTRVGLGTARPGAEWDEILDLHLAIADAVSGKSSEKARRSMSAHFDSALTRLRRSTHEQGKNRD